MDLISFNEIVDLSNYFAGFLAFIVVLIHSAIKKKEWLNYVIIIIYLSYGIVMIYYGLQVSRKLLDYPHLTGISWPFHIFGFTGVYFYAKILLVPGYKPDYKQLLFFLPGILYLIVLIPLVYIRGIEEKTALLLNFFYNNTDPQTNVFTLCVYYHGVVKFIFIILTINETRILWNRERIKNLKFFRMVFLIAVGLLIALSVSIVGSLDRNDFFHRISSVIFNVVVFMPLFLSYRYPDFMHNFSVEVSREKYKRSQLRGVNVDAVISRLKDLMEIEKVYTDPELNIKAVSEQLQISNHQLSEIFNDKLGVNYSAFINNYRIEEAKKNLIREPDDTILQIAYSVGFNSKTSFNKVFKRITNFTPSEFRMNNYSENPVNQFRAS